MCTGWVGLGAWPQEARRAVPRSLVNILPPLLVNILPPLPTPLSPCHFSGAIVCFSSGSQAPILPFLSPPAPSAQDTNVTAPLNGAWSQPLP